MAVTIKDIAKVAGVSHTTVSRALRDHPAIAPGTTVRIKRIAAEMGYVPSAVARGLKTSRNHALGVIVSRIDDPFFSEILQGIEDAAQEAAYSLFVAASHRVFEREKAIVQAMGERRVDGIIVCSTHVSAQHSLQLKQYGLPIVVVDNQAAEDYEYSIYHDDLYGSHQVTRHLIDLGHTRIAYMGNARAGRTTLERLSGFREAMQAAGLPIPESFIFQAPNGLPEGGLVGAQYFLQLPERPTAIVCFNDMSAIGLLRGLQVSGVQIPKDCSVAGFDNIALAAFVTPPLTTFHQPKYELGYEAARMVLDLLNPSSSSGRTAPAKILRLRGELLVRASTAPPNPN